jgi:signal transduction histidine kinase
MGQKQVKEPYTTFFAPASVASPEELARSIRQVSESALLTHLLEAVGSVMFVLNPERQIIAANSAALKTLDLTVETVFEAMGLRPGEALGCIHVEATPNGCGTGKICASCGAARAIMDAQLNQRVVEYEFLLTTKKNGEEFAHEFQIRAAPFELDSRPLLLLTLHSIADKKRREILERTFFHDLLNTLGALNGYRSLAENGLLAEPQTLRQLGGLIDRIVEEVRTHRALLNAENQHLTLKLETCSTLDIVEKLKVTFEHHEVRDARTFEIDCAQETLTTDRTLVLRILTNMLKNAFEATPPAGTVRFRCYKDGHHIVFAAHNPGYIPEDVAARIFTRSFTTKGEPGRGLGTYGMKLFGEHYLHGKITFTSSEAEGTEFLLRLPLRLDEPFDSIVQLRVHPLTDKA